MPEVAGMVVAWLTVCNGNTISVQVSLLWFRIYLLLLLTYMWNSWGLCLRDYVVFSQDAIGGKLSYKGRVNLDKCDVKDSADGEGEWIGWYYNITQRILYYTWIQLTWLHRPQAYCNLLIMGSSLTWFRAVATVVAIMALNGYPINAHCINWAIDSYSSVQSLLNDYNEIHGVIIFQYSHASYAHPTLIPSPEVASPVFNSLLGHCDWCRVLWLA